MSSIAPGFVRLTYSGSIKPHHAQMAVQFATDPTPGLSPSFKMKTNPAAISAEAALSAYLSLLVGCFHTSTIFGLAEVYSVTADTGERQFLYAFDTDTAGIVTGTTRKELQVAILSMKTELGHPLKIYMQESIYTPNVRYNSGALPEEVQAVADYISGEDSWISGWDNSYAFAAKSFTTKTFDPTRRQAGI